MGDEDADSATDPPRSSAGEPDSAADPPGSSAEESDQATDPPRPSGAPAGFDEADPYADVDLESYPDWWRENVEAFRAHGMRPYRPPQFDDGSLVPELLDRLEGDLGVEITLCKHIGADATESWKALVDGEAVATFDRVRNEEGRSVYSVTAGEFERLLRAAVET